MKKIIAILLATAVIFSILPSISAIREPIGEPGSAIVTDYCFPEHYVLGTFSLGSGQSITFNIPSTACPPLKKEQIGGLRRYTAQIGDIFQIGQIDADTTEIDDTQYSYNCYYTESCGITRYLLLCVTQGSIGDLSLEVFDAQGNPLQTGGDSNGCSSFYIDSDAVKVVITNNTTSQTTITGEISINECCCYDCYKIKPVPTTLYPKIDIETFSVPGGATVIKDGKVISPFEMSPGTQQVFLQVENRGFFTQNDTRLRFEGLPNGVTVDVFPDTQVIKAHNLGTYSANFTIGPNVPSGTYLVTMIAYSPNGMFDKITFEFIVP